MNEHVIRKSHDVVNERHIIRKSHDATQKKVHFNVPCDWFETNWRHQKRYSEGSKKICGCRSLPERVINQWATMWAEHAQFGNYCR